MATSEQALHPCLDSAQIAGLDACCFKIVELDANERCDPPLSLVLQYWERKRKGRIGPRRRDIDPADLVPALPHLALIDVLPVPLDFRYRLSGTYVDRLHGMNLAGKRPLDLGPPAYGKLLDTRYRESVRRSDKLLYRIEVSGGWISLSFLRLLLPLSDDSMRVTMLLEVSAQERSIHTVADLLAKQRGPTHTSIDSG